MIIKSRVKYIQSLGQKKFRDQEAVFIAEGPKTVNELLGSSNIEVVDLYAVSDWVEQNNINADGSTKSRLIEIDESTLARISQLTTPNLVLGIFRKPQWQAPQLKNKISLMLEDIQDPGNMGTIVRLADWFGVELIVCSPQCADAFGPKAIQSSMGSICRVQILYTDLKKFLPDHAGIPLLAATLDGPSLYQTNVLQEAIILLGNESRGISSELMNASSQQVTIPRKGKAESLNAAIAAGIILSWFRR